VYDELGAPAAASGVTAVSDAADAALSLLRLQRGRSLSLNSSCHDGYVVHATNAVSARSDAGLTNLHTLSELVTAVRAVTLELAHPE
jgi:hypothetical protein